MSKQYNKAEKRQRRNAYLKRRKSASKKGRTPATAVQDGKAEATA